MIYDCFPFHDELDLLEVRLNELKDVVDRFVLVESDITFQHSPKPLYFEENKHRFEEFLDRIEHVIVRDAPITSFFDTDIFQRNQIMRGLEGCNDDDIIFISDADEIPRAEAVTRYMELPDRPFMSLQLSLHYYYFNCWAGTQSVAKVIPYGMVKNFDSIQAIRGDIWKHGEEWETPKTPVLLDAGWHFTYLGDESRLIHKLKSFAHAQFNTPEFLDPERIRKEINRGEDVIMDGPPFTWKPIEHDMPQYVLDNQSRFAHLIRTDPFPASSWVSEDTATVSCTSTKIKSVT